MGDIGKYNLKPIVKFLNKVFPVKSENEEKIRETDKAKAAAGDFNNPAEKEPAIVDGKLNRNKLLVGTTIFYDDDRINDADIQRIAEGGFDFIINESGGAFQNLLIELCQKHGVALISKDKSLPSGSGIHQALGSGKNLFSEYIHHAIRVGDTAGDEPHASLFASIGDYYRLYKNQFPDKFLFLNLFPAGVPSKLLGAKNYRDYIAKFLNEVPSDFISLDEYPFFSVSLLKKMSLKICLHTYDVVGTACRENNRDFWLYLQTQGHWFDRIYTLPTYEQIRWQVYTALAYGTKCIMHISYTPVWGTEAYAMVDKQGLVTEQYLYARKINEELNLLSPVYMQYRNLGVLPIQAKRNNASLKRALNYQKKSSAQKGFTGLDCVKSLCSEYTSVAGFFEKTDGSGYALLLVNCRNLYSPHAAQNIDVYLKYPCRITVYKGGTEQATISGKAFFSVPLQSCEGAFVTIEKLYSEPMA